MTDKMREEFEAWYLDNIWPSMTATNAKGLMLKAWQACAEKSAAEITELKEIIENMECQLLEAAERAE